MSKNNNLKDFLTDIADAIRRKKGTTDPINPQDFSTEIDNLSSGIAECEWQPSADMQWGKSVCENDVNTDDPNLDTYKIFQYMSASYISDTLSVPNGGAIKTSDGHYYSTSGDIKHVWTNEGEYFSQDEPGSKLRWIITYYTQHSITNNHPRYLLPEVRYVCFNRVKFSNIVSYKKCLQYFDIINIDNNQNVVTTMNNLFNGCYSLQSIPLLDTSNVTSMNQAFLYCHSLKYIPLLNTSKVKDMSNLFGECGCLTSIPELDTSNVTSMSHMFRDCLSLVSIPSFNTSKVTSMYGMFSGCKCLQYIPYLDMHNVTNAREMFDNCQSLNTVENIDTSNITNMIKMFYHCDILQSINNLNLDKVTSMASIFSSNYYLEYLTITNAKVSFDIYYSTNFSRETLVNIIDNLADLTGLTAQTLKMGTTNKNKLSAEDIAIATAKNWTIA